MKSRRCFLFMFFILSLTLGCKRQCDANIHMGDLRQDVEKIIRKYMNEHPQYNTFILQVNPKIPYCEDSLSACCGFLLGPGYEELLDSKSVYMNIEGKRVFVLTDFAFLLKECSTIKLDNDFVSDSITIGQAAYWEPEILYVSKGIFFYKNKADSFNVNFRPDTIFFPKRSTESLEFINEEKI